MNKTTLTFLVASLLISGTAFAQSAPQPAVVPMDTMQVGTQDPAMQQGTSGDQVPMPISQMKGTCTVNGKEVDCEKLMEGVGSVVGTGLKIILGIAIIGIICFVFWLMMLIHVIKNPVPNKALWIICFIFFGIITAIVYYFAVKRSFVASAPAIPPSTPPTTFA